MAGKNELLKQINEVSFSLYDLVLYLDTHPEDADALEMFAKLQKERGEAVEKFSQSHYPLVLDSIQAIDSNEWAWGNVPAPWEVEANVEL